MEQMIKKGDKIQLKKDTYEILDYLGQGAYGIVWKAQRVSDSEVVALKFIQTNSLSDSRIPYSTTTLSNVIDKLKWEIDFLSKIGYERARKNHILPLLDHGEYQNTPVMVMPCCEYSLNHAYIKRQSQETFPFDSIALLRWIGQIATALAVFHDMDVDGEKFIHRDLKFNNVLVKDNALYLADFGTVKKLQSSLTSSMAGTLELWGVPEIFIPAKVIDNKPKYAHTPAIDLYSLGLIVYALITCHFPTGQAKILVSSAGYVSGQTTATVVDNDILLHSEYGYTSNH